MGWWWKSSSPSNPVVPASAAVSHASTECPLPSSPPAAPVKQQLSREEQSNLEWLELLKELQEQSEVSADTTVAATAAIPAGPAKRTAPLPADISPDSLYPTEISCRSAFDYAMFCQSFGGQFVNVYRYGSFRSCSNHWEDFWLCMRTRNWDEKDRKRAIQEHYRKKAVKWRTGPSSEDVWEVRTEPVLHAFQGNLEALESRIAQWQKDNPGAPDPWQQPRASFPTSNAKS